MGRLPIAGARATAVVIDGRELVYFGGCGYLGLAHHPRVVEAAVRALRRFGLSTGAARETSGNSVLHDELELELARRLGTEAAVLVPEGFTANLAAAQAMKGLVDLVLIDQRSHASVFDSVAAAQLESEVFPHLDLAALRSVCERRSDRRIAIATDTVFPSRGELAPFAELAACARDFEALVWLDDCHGTGVIGARGLGALECGELDPTRVVLTSTLSKALGCYGGFVAATSRWIARTREHSQVYLGTTPIPPAIAAAALVALELAFDSRELVDAMRANAARLRKGFQGLGLPTGHAELPVFAFSLDRRERMERLHEQLLARGLLAPLIVYGDGPASGNFRIVVTAAHTPDEIDRLLAALGEGLARTP